MIIDIQFGKFNNSTYGVGINFNVVQNNQVSDYVSETFHTLVMLLFFEAIGYVIVFRIGLKVALKLLGPMLVLGLRLEASRNGLWASGLVGFVKSSTFRFD